YHFDTPHGSSILENVFCVVLSAYAELPVVVSQVLCSSICPVHISGILVSARVYRIPSHGIESGLAPVEVTLGDESCPADYCFSRCIPAHLLSISCPCQYSIVIICGNPVHIVIFFAAGRDVSIGIKPDTLGECTCAIPGFMQSM